MFPHHLLKKTFKKAIFVICLFSGNVFSQSNIPSESTLPSIIPDVTNLNSGVLGTFSLTYQITPKSGYQFQTPTPTSLICPAGQCGIIFCSVVDVSDTSDTTCGHLYGYKMDPYLSLGSNGTYDLNMALGIYVDGCGNDDFTFNINCSVICQTYTTAPSTPQICSQSTITQG